MEESSLAFVLLEPLDKVALLHRCLEDGLSPRARKATWMLRVRRALGRALGPPRPRTWSFEATDGSTLVKLHSEFAVTAYPALVDIAIDEGLTVWDSDAAELVVPLPTSRPVAKLREALDWLSAIDDAWIICEGGADLAYYVQFVALGAAGARLEAVAGRHIPVDTPSPPDLHRKLALHGLSTGIESAPNLSCRVELSSPGERNTAALRALNILSEVYDVSLGGLTRMRLGRPHHARAETEAALLTVEEEVR